MGQRLAISATEGNIRMCRALRHAAPVRLVRDRRWARRRARAAVPATSRQATTALPRARAAQVAAPLRALRGASPMATVLTIETLTASGSSSPA